MNEAQFYRTQVRSHLSSWGHHCRIENVAAVGMPDINYAINPSQGWLELKMIKSRKLYFQKFQLPWMKSRIRETGGKHVWVLATNEDALFLYPARILVRAPITKVKNWSVFSQDDLEPEVAMARPYDWGLIREALIEG